MEYTGWRGKQENNFVALWTRLECYHDSRYYPVTQIALLFSCKACSDAETCALADVLSYEVYD